MSDLGWWAISGEELLAMLNRVEEGENSDLVYAEAYVNAEAKRLNEEES